MNKTTLTIAEGTRMITRCEEQIEKIIIPDSVKTLYPLAFEDFSSLTEIIIGNGLTYICDFAFRGCKSLTEIIVPENVIFIGEYAFSGCSSLKSIYINQEKDSLDLSATGIPEDCKVYWKGEWNKEEEE